MAIGLSLAAFLIPVVIVAITGATPAIARILIGAGIVLYISSSVLRTYFARKDATTPNWVAALGLIGTGLAPAGLAILLCLSLGLIAD